MVVFVRYVLSFGQEVFERMILRFCASYFVFFVFVLP